MAVTIDQIQGLDFGSNVGAGDSFRVLDVDVSDVGDAVALAVAESPTKGLRLTRGIFDTATDIDQAAAELDSMLVAVKDDAAGRDAVVRSARLAEGGVLLVDRVSRLPLAEAKPFVADFLATGGSTQDIAIWLRTVGAVVRGRRSDDGTLGGVIDAIGGFIEDAVDAVVEGVETIVDAVVDAVGSLADAIADAVSWTLDQLADLATALLEAGQSIAEILVAAAEEGLAFVERMGEALLEAGEAIVDVLSEIADVAIDALEAVVAAISDLAEVIVDIAEFLATAAVNIVREVVRGLVTLAGGVVNLIVDIAQFGLAVMREVVVGLLEIGETLVGLVLTLGELALDALEVLFEAAIELGLVIGELVAELATIAYDTVAAVVKAALAAGIAVLELVENVVSAGYFAFRRIVNGVILALGPVGEILDAVLTSIEDFVGDGWRQVMNALRFAEAEISEALDWARAQGVEIMGEILQAWEDIGESLLDAYAWAKQVALDTGDAVFDMIGELTVKLQNSVSYVLGYLENDFLEGLGDFTVGLLEAGYAVFDLVARVVERSIAVIAEVFKAAISVGTTLAELMLAVATEPSAIMDKVLGALEEMDQTLTDLMAAVEEEIDALGEDVMASLLRLNAAMEQVIGAIFEINGGFIGLAISLLLNRIASYRPLSAAERAVAEPVFGDSLDYDDIFISQDDLVNEIIFWVQDGFGEDPGSRAFVTGNLINFDVDDGALTNATLIHELTHVWQHDVEGPAYLTEAVHAQLVEEVGGPDAYNYGFDDTDDGDSNGTGGETALNDSVFDDFNPEQQGMIIEHYYVRRFEASLDFAAWQPYIDHVQGVSQPFADRTIADSPLAA